MMEKRKHQFVFCDGRWHCEICQWSWITRKQSACPGVPHYGYSTLPDGMKPLSAALRDTIQPDACYWRRREPHWLWFCHEENLSSVSSSLRKYSERICALCGEIAVRPTGYWPLEEDLCTLCQFELEWLHKYDSIEQWTTEAWSSQSMILTTETTGLENNDVVIALTMLPVQDPSARFKTLIQSQKPISPEATAYHRIWDEDLRSAPPFSHVWAKIVEMFEQYSTIICYNAKFHRDHLDFTAHQYGFTLPNVEWHCLQNGFTTYYGKVRPDLTFDRLSLEHACNTQHLFHISSSRIRMIKRAMEAKALFQAFAEGNVSHWEN
jgi:DNA polymerase III epsilon subunit-like protein